MTPDEYREQHGMDDDGADTVNDGPLVIFKSAPDFWMRERCGNKPNTVRLLTPQEYTERLRFADECMEVGEPATIEIVNTETLDGFFRRITDICCIGELPGYDMWVVSWQHEDGEGSYRDPEEAS